MRPSIEEEKLLLRLRQLRSKVVLVAVDEDGKPSFVSVMSATEDLSRKEPKVQ